MQASDATMRIARSSAEAASGYATAAFAAYADMASQTMSFWAQTIDSMMPKAEPEPRSWYRPPGDAPRAPARRAAPSAPVWPGPNAAMPGFAGFNMFGQGGGSAGPFGPSMFGPGHRSPMDLWQAWFRMWPLQGPPACWPMAFAMMGAGWSREVAYPAARANVAAMDAVTTAVEVARQPFSSYRSDSGYACAQIVVAGNKVASAVAVPIGAALLAPWLQAFTGMSARM